MNKKVIASLRNVFDGIMVFMLFVGTTVYALPSNGVTYDNSSSGSSATNVGDAIDDLYSKLSIKDNEINRLKGIGNASSNNILSGYTALVQGSTVTGSIPSKGATTYTPGTQNQTIASNQYLSGNQTIKGDANLISANILEGKNIFGVEGSIKNNSGKTLDATNITKDDNYTYINIPEIGYYDKNSKLKIINYELDSSSKFKKLLLTNMNTDFSNKSSINWNFDTKDDILINSINVTGEVNTSFSHNARGIRFWFKNIGEARKLKIVEMNMEIGVYLTITIDDNVVLNRKNGYISNIEYDISDKSVIFFNFVQNEPWYYGTGATVKNISVL